jgi:hypothetical protein
MIWQIIRDGYSTSYNGMTLGVHFNTPTQKWIISVNSNIISNYYFDTLQEAQKSVVAYVTEAERHIP